VGDCVLNPWWVSAFRKAGTVLGLYVGLFTGRAPAGREGRGESPMDTYRWQCKEGDGEDREAGGDGLPDPCLGHLVPVADGGDCDLEEQGQKSAARGSRI
jgi:hypothetical protein